MKTKLPGLCLTIVSILYWGNVTPVYGQQSTLITYLYNSDTVSISQNVLFEEHSLKTNLRSETFYLKAEKNNDVKLLLAFESSLIPGMFWLGSDTLNLITKVNEFVHNGQKAVIHSNIDYLKVNITSIVHDRANGTFEAKLTPKQGKEYGPVSSVSITQGKFFNIPIQ